MCVYVHFVMLCLWVIVHKRICGYVLVCGDVCVCLHV